MRSLRPRRVSVELPWERDRRCTGHGPRAVPCWEPTRSDLWRHTAPVLGSRDGAPQQTAPHRAPGCRQDTDPSPGGTAVIGVSPGGRDSLGMEQGMGSGKTGSADGDGAGARVSSETRPQPEGIQKASSSTEILCSARHLSPRGQDSELSTSFAYMFHNQSLPPALHLFLCVVLCSLQG